MYGVGTTSTSAAADFILVCLFAPQEDDPESVVERVAEENILDSAMKAVLLARIRKEMDKRRNKR